MMGGRTAAKVPSGGGGAIMPSGPIIGGGRIPSIGGGMAPGGISIGGIPGAPGIPAGIRLGLFGLVRLGGGIVTPGGFAGPPLANGF